MSQVATSLDHLASPSSGEKPGGWPKWRLHAFRFAVAVSIIAGMRMVPLFSNYLVAGAAEMASPIFDAISEIEYQTVMRTGALLIDTALGREPRPWQQMLIRNNPNAATGALCYAIGIVVIASAITLLWGALDRKRVAYSTLYASHRLYVRYLVALTMMSSGSLTDFSSGVRSSPHMSFRDSSKCGTSPARRTHSFPRVAQPTGGVSLVTTDTGAARVWSCSMWMAACGGFGPALIPRHGH